MKLVKPWVPHGKAIEAWWEGDKKATIKIKMEDGSVTEMLIDIYFRTREELPEVEALALEYCNGKVLDVGAGAGSHSLILQREGHVVTALDISKKAVEIMQRRGVTQVIHGNFLDFETPEKFDTLLFLMNGIGIASDLKGLETYLKKAKSLLKKNGKIILDSSDLRNGEVELDFSSEYFGIIPYQLQFEDYIGEWYNWLYIDQEKLTQVAEENSWKCEIIYEQEDGSYLARLTLKE